MQYEGATKERQGKEKVIITARSSRVGGDVGHAVEQPLLLDKLRKEGFLGSDYDDQEVRYTSGYKLRELWYGFNSSASEETTLPKGKTGMYQFETDDATTKDEAEQRFNQVMRCVPKKYHKTLYEVCIEDNHREVCWKVVDKKTGEEYVLCAKDRITDSLDALYGALRRVE